MKKSSILIFTGLLCLGTIFIFSCKPKEKLIAVDFKDSEIKVKKGEILKIELKANPTTGYQWQIDSTADKKLTEFQGSEYKPDKTDNKMMGSGGKETFKFKTIAKGKSVLKFKYVRPAEPQKVQDAKIFKINVE